MFKFFRISGNLDFLLQIGKAWNLGYLEALEFLMGSKGEMARMLEYFRADLEKYYLIYFQTKAPSLGQRLRLWMEHYGLHCTLVYRVGQQATLLHRSNRFLGLIALLFYFFISLPIKAVHHVYVSRHAEIGPGFYISHVGTIYIGDVRIGANFSTTHNVTIGKGHTKSGVKIPTEIGENVWIGTGSVIAGDVSIGDAVTVMPLSLVTKPLPGGVLVGGNPARVILKEYDNAHLFGERHLDG